MEKKYKLTEETLKVYDKTLYRIEALKDFNDVKKGDKGGFIENEKNLSQSGDCWIYDNAKVLGEAMVCCNAKVYGNAKICDYAVAYDNAIVFGNAQVCDEAKVYYNAKVYGNARIYGKARVLDNARVYGNTNVYHNAEVCGNTRIYGNAIVRGDAVVCGDAVVYDNAAVYGNARIYGNAEICGDAEIASNSDYIVFKNWWSSGRYFTWTKGNDMWKVGCFYGTGEQLIEKAYKDSELSGKEYKKVVVYVNSIKANEYDHVRKNIKERLLLKIRKLFGK